MHEPGSEANGTTACIYIAPYLTFDEKLRVLQPSTIGYTLVPPLTVLPEW